MVYRESERKSAYLFRASFTEQSYKKHHVERTLRHYFCIFAVKTTLLHA